MNSTIRLKCDSQMRSFLANCPANSVSSFLRRARNGQTYDDVSCKYYQVKQPNFIRVENGSKGIVSYVETVHIKANPDKGFGDYIFLPVRMAQKKLSEDKKTDLLQYEGVKDWDEYWRFVNDPYSEEFDKHRTTTKIGRLIHKIFTKDGLAAYVLTDTKNERFVNAFKGFFVEDDEEMVQVNGDDILWGYLDANYYSEWGENGSLFSSCMRYDYKNHYMTMYVNSSSCSMLILKKDGLVSGRALLWKTNCNTKLMDRIYTIRDSDVTKFTNWAKEKGYLHKEEQSYDNDTFIDPETDDTINQNWDISVSPPDNFYPYCDTFYRYCDISGIITNNEDEGDDELRGENGETDLRRRSIINTDDLLKTTDDDVVYVDDHDGYAPYGEAERCKHHQSYFLTDDVEFSSYEDDFVPLNSGYFSELYDCQLFKDTSRYSGYHGTYIPTDEASEWINKDGDYDFIDCSHTETYIDAVNSAYVIPVEIALESKYHKGYVSPNNSDEVVRLDGTKDYANRRYTTRCKHTGRLVLKDDSYYIWGTGWVLKTFTQTHKESIREEEPKYLADIRKQ